MAVSGITVSGTLPRLSSPKTIPPDVNESTLEDLEDLEANTIPRMDAGISMRDPSEVQKIRFMELDQDRSRKNNSFSNRISTLLGDVVCDKE